jgi:hypothetical protein
MNVGCYAPPATSSSTVNRLVFAAVHESASGPSAKFLAHAKKSLVTGVMQTRFEYVGFFA